MEKQLEDAIKALTDEYKWLKNCWEAHYEDARQATSEGDSATEKTAMERGNMYISRMNTLNSGFFFKHGKWTGDEWTRSNQ